MSETVSILSNILNMDVFLDCPTKDKDNAVVVYHARRNKQSLLKKYRWGNGTFIKGTSSFSNFLTGLPSKTIKLLLRRNSMYFKI